MHLTEPFGEPRHVARTRRLTARDIAELVSRYLEKAGYRVDLLGSGREALLAMLVRPPALLVLDLMLPHVDGLEICRVARANVLTAAIPIIMLTSRAEESDRIVGLEVGADDYLPKPFSPNELVARVRALLRRSQRASNVTGQLTYGRIAIDAARQRVVLDDVPAALTTKGFLLFSYLLAHRGRVLSRHRLLEDVWGYSYTDGTRTLDVHVRRLRDKLPPLATALVTIKQFGYKLLDVAPAGHQNE
jgi:DNA-binding response OmpR family regulator